GDQIVEADVLSMFGLTAQGQIHSLARQLLEGQVEPALRQLNDLAKTGKDLGRLLSELLNHFRNLLIYQVSRGDRRLLEVTESESVALAEQSVLAPTEALTRMMEVLTDCEGRLREAVSKKTLIEVALFRVIQARQATSLDGVLKQLQRLRETEGGPASTSPAAAPRAANAPAAPGAESRAPRPDPAPPAAQPILQTKSAPAAAPPVADLEKLWANIIEGVGRVSAFVRTYLLQGHPVALENKVFTIGFDPQFADNLHLVDNAKSRTLIQTKLRELGHEDVVIKFIQAEAPAGRAPAVPSAPPTPEPSEPAGGARRKEAPKAEKPGPAAVTMDDFKNDPLIRQALEIFKGKIVDVRA
ncbi:MAG: DNA polymerase III subunit gamma/tau, partial [Verrucomicrobia bacterium]|nr:DNA polymerase III subunit gamma/tau [Verrucomicrobiota bacterium]